MAKPSAQRIVSVLMERYGRTYAQELDIPLRRATPSPLFRLLCASLLFSARISAGIAVAAAKALADHGLTTPSKMADAGWSKRTRILNRSGYARYDERTSTMLGQTAEKLMEEYGGDLRRLRDRAEREVATERRLLKEFKGIGEVGADIFLREVQAVWDEVYPFADSRTLVAAKRLGLPGDAAALAKLVGREDYPALLVSCFRAKLDRGERDVQQQAGRR